MASKSIEEKYKKHTHREHILEIPDTYVGSVEECVETLWVLDSENNKMVRETIKYIPALYKLFDEGLVNAIDHSIRLEILKKENKKVNLVSNIKVEINNKRISIYNDGDGIDVERHKEHNQYIPSLIFGELLTSSNYDKSEVKHVGGKNGYGAKLINIFSSEFGIETYDHIRKKHFQQIYYDNMTRHDEPIIKKTNLTPFTKITWEADFERFGISEYSQDMIKLFKKRVYDASAVTNNNVSVYLNGEKLEFKGFEKYIDLYLGSKDDKTRVYERINDRWEVAIALNEEEKFEQISFVNGISTIKGGKHTDYVSNIIAKKMVDLIHKKKKINVKPNYIKENMLIFIKCTIDNPSFGSQTKDTLTTPIAKFGSKCDINDKFIDKFSKTGIVEKVISLTEWKDNANLKKTDGRKQNILRGIPKLDDANWAGGNKSKHCTLILTEGDSAKSMAVAGLSVIGRDKYGIFPLKGKVLNVRDAKVEKIGDNVEINNIKKILGLQTGKEYDNINDLRYGSIMIMTDQDVDGSHIKGLLINLFDSLWPNLIKLDGFITSMLTPVIKATKNKKSEWFYTIADYDKWKKSNKKGWEIKYYKGLGTSTSKEAKEYFEELKIVKYQFSDLCKNAIDKAFNKNRSDDRKDWLKSHNKEDVLDANQELVSCSEFIEKDLIQFSVDDTARSIPNIMDGFKISQRKILYSAFKRNLKKEIRVAQFAGYVSEHSAYHHGEMSLQGAIVGMAQNYVGSNNINLLKPNGQFGTRLMGGKDSASCRYIHTELCEITSTLFKKDDELILKNLDDDGYMVEPEYYVPILPLILINGAIGIGTGFSTNIPCFNPKDIIKNIKNKMNGEEFTRMKIWYRGFTGEIKQFTNSKGCTSYTTHGIYKILNNHTLEISELPIGKWTDDYYEYLDTLATDHSNKKKSEKKTVQYIRSIDKYHTDSTVRFVLNFMPNMLTKLMIGDNGSSMEKLENLLKLSTQKTLSNLHLFNSKGVIQKYENELEVLEEFYYTRLEYYTLRKACIIDKLNNELKKIGAKVKFILDCINDTILIKNIPKKEIINKLEELEYPKMKDDIFNEETGDYNYLLKMEIWNLTMEKKDSLLNEEKNKNEMVDELNSKSETDLWLNDIELFEKEYTKFLKETSESKNEVKKKKKITINK